MRRFTEDVPEGNFETMMNFVFSRDGWVHIRHDGEMENVLLTEWVRAQCLNRDCTYMKGLTTAEEIDNALCDCLTDVDGCPVALSYCFAAQASHLRDRLKAIEDILGDEYDLDHLRELTQAEKSGRLVVLAVNPYLKPAQTNEVFICENGGVWAIYVTGCEVGPNSEGRLAVIYETVDGDVFCDTDIGKTVFLTRQEAEEAMRKEAENVDLK